MARRKQGNFSLLSPWNGQRREDVLLCCGLAKADWVTLGFGLKLACCCWASRSAAHSRCPPEAHSAGRGGGAMAEHRGSGNRSCLLRVQCLQPESSWARKCSASLEALQRHAPQSACRTNRPFAADHDQVRCNRVVRRRGHQLDHVSGRECALLPSAVVTFQALVDTRING